MDNPWSQKKDFPKCTFGLKGPKLNIFFVERSRSWVLLTWRAAADLLFVGAVSRALSLFFSVSLSLFLSFSLFLYLFLFFLFFLSLSLYEHLRRGESFPPFFTRPRIAAPLATRTTRRGLGSRPLDDDAGALLQADTSGPPPSHTHGETYV